MRPERRAATDNALAVILQHALRTNEIIFSLDRSTRIHQSRNMYGFVGLPRSDTREDFLRLIHKKFLLRGFRPRTTPLFGEIFIESPTG